MKRICTILLCLPFLLQTMAKAQCGCEKNPDLESMFYCDTNRFDNGAFVFIGYDCEMSCITFQNKQGLKKQLESKDLKLGSKIGYHYATEYKNYFLIQNNLISGCCTPPEFLLFNKNTGQLKKNLGSLLFYSEDKTLPFAIGFSNSKTVKPADILNYLILYNINTGKEFKIKLTKGEIEKAMNQSNEMHVEFLFETGELKDSQLKLNYRVYKTEDNEKPATKTVIIQLSKYLK